MTDYLISRTMKEIVTKKEKISKHTFTSSRKKLSKKLNILLLFFRKHLIQLLQIKTTLSIIEWFVVFISITQGSLQLPFYISG